MSAIQVSEDTVLILWTNKQIINQMEVNACKTTLQHYVVPENTHTNPKEDYNSTGERMNPN